MADSNRRIMELEEHLYRSRSEYTEELHLEAPRFTVPLENINDLREGENAHLEARLTPTNDPDLKVEWFKNGKAIFHGMHILIYFIYFLLGYIYIYIYESVLQ